MQTAAASLELALESEYLRVSEMEQLQPLNSRLIAEPTEPLDLHRGVESKKMLTDNFQCVASLWGNVNYLHIPETTFTSTYYEAVLLLTSWSELRSCIKVQKQLYIIVFPPHKMKAIYIEYTQWRVLINKYGWDW